MPIQLDQPVVPITLPPSFQLPASSSSRLADGRIKLERR